MFTTDYMDLARGLQNSNVKEVSDLAKGYLKLAEMFDDLQGKYVKACAESVMVKHEKLFKKLAESGD